MKEDGPPRSVPKWSLAKCLKDLRGDSDAPPALRDLLAEGCWDANNTLGDSRTEVSSAPCGQLEAPLSRKEVGEPNRDEVLSRQSSPMPVRLKGELCPSDAVEEVSELIRTFSVGSASSQSWKSSDRRKVAQTPSRQFAGRRSAGALSMLIPLTTMGCRSAVSSSFALGSGRKWAPLRDGLKSASCGGRNGRRYRSLTGRKTRSSFQNGRKRCRQTPPGPYSSAFLASYPCSGRQSSLHMLPRAREPAAHRSDEGGRLKNKAVVGAAPAPCPRPRNGKEQPTAETGGRRPAGFQTRSERLSESVLSTTTCTPILELLGPQSSPRRKVHGKGGFRGGVPSFRSQLDGCFSPGGTSWSSNNYNNTNNNRITCQNSEECLDNPLGAPHSQSNAHRLKRASRVCAAVTLRGVGDRADVRMGAALSQGCISPISSLWASTTIAIDMRLSLYDAPLDLLMTSTDTACSTQTTV